MTDLDRHACEDSRKQYWKQRKTGFFAGKEGNTRPLCQCAQRLLSRIIFYCFHLAGFAFKCSALLEAHFVFKLMMHVLQLAGKFAHRMP